MKKQDYHVSITVKATAEEVFKSISSVSEWWSEDLHGSPQKPGDEFTVHFGETSITVQLVEFISYRKISWYVTDCYKHWLKDKKEWKGTKMVWEILSEGDMTQINFTHIGLVPGLECYGGCEKAWDFYIKESLFKFLTEGKGTPELKVKQKLSA